MRPGKRVNAWRNSREYAGRGGGVRTAKAALGLAQRCGVDMPIVQEVNAVLFADKSCRRAVGDLMEREAKGEKNTVMNPDQLQALLTNVQQGTLWGA